MSCCLQSLHRDKGEQDDSGQEEFRKPENKHNHESLESNNNNNNSELVKSKQAGDIAGVSPDNASGSSGKSISEHNADSGHPDSPDDDGLGPLPPNWEKAYTDKGEPYFIDHNSGEHNQHKP